MNKEDIYNEIVEWGNENAESFVDYFNSDIKEVTFMSWCLGKGYLTREKFNKWVESYSLDEIESVGPNYYLYDSDGGDVEFAVVISDEWNHNSQDEAYKILSEFISEVDIYILRFKKFIDSYEEV